MSGFEIVPQVLHRLQNKEKPIRTTFTLRFGSLKMIFECSIARCDVGLGRAIVQCQKKSTQEAKIINKQGNFVGPFFSSEILHRLFLLVRWFVGSLARWFVGSLVRWLVGSLVRWFVGSLARRLVGWLVGWLVGCLVLWFVGSLVRWFAGSLVRWLAGLLACLLAGWLAGQLAVWLVG